MNNQRQANTRIKWYNVTSYNTKHIIPTQKWLFDKYLTIEPNYLDVNKTPIEKWGVTVASMLPTDEYIIFGLDDFLPIDVINYNNLDKALEILKENNLDRFELSHDACRKIGFIQEDGWLRYGRKTPYKVSTQFSIWKTETLHRELARTTTPWRFETQGICEAGCFNTAVFRWIEESALSGRRSGKINLCGLRLQDEQDLINLGFINKENVIYGWKGTEERKIEFYGTKYKEYYD